MPFKIKYKFKEDEKFYTCKVTYNQFQDFAALSIVEECDIIEEGEEDFNKIEKQMQKALDLAATNDTSHIKKLFQ